jgi:hypothetical protein
MLKWILSASVAIAVVAVAATFALTGDDSSGADRAPVPSAACAQDSPQCDATVLAGEDADRAAEVDPAVDAGLPVAAGACVPGHPNCEDMVVIDEGGLSVGAPVIGDLPNAERS